MRTATSTSSRTTPLVAQKKSVAAKDHKLAVGGHPALQQATHKTRSAKVVHRRFSMPEVEYNMLTELKRKCLAAGINVKKSELLRIGLHFLETVPVARLQTAVTALESAKNGRKSAEKKAGNGKLAKPH